jgi:hypothetical protein
MQRTARRGTADTKHQADADTFLQNSNAPGQASPTNHQRGPSEAARLDMYLVRWRLRLRPPTRGRPARWVCRRGPSGGASARVCTHTHGAASRLVALDSHLDAGDSGPSSAWRASAVTERNWVMDIATASPTFASFAAKRRRRAALAPPPTLPHVVLPLRQWDRYVGPWKNHFGKGRKQAYPLFGVEPKPNCAEVGVVQLVRRYCQHAFWVSC